MPINRRMALGLLGAGGTAWLLFSREARAGVAVGLTLAELVRKSSVVAFARALEARSSWAEVGGARRIVTDHRVRLDEVLYGSPADPTVWVRTLGGRVERLRAVVYGEAELRVSEPCLLFLQPGAEGVLGVTGLAQGHYPLRNRGGALRLFASPRLGALLRPGGCAVQDLVGRSRAEAASLLDEASRGAR
jgi:hypothetical protein